MGHGHLESPDRIKIIEQALRQAPFKKNFHQAQTVNPNDILRVHDRSLHTLVKASQARGRHMFTPDTIANQYTYQAALTAAGGSIQTGLNAKVRPSFAMVRPPGHHATHSTVMGFCFYNNIAITAGYLRQHNYKRIAIIDVDNPHFQEQVMPQK
jgi:acetoin utilization deacetylase AcuC-like enzyme